VLPGVDAQAAKAGLAGALGGNATLTVVQAQPDGQNGQTRVHAGSGEPQRFMGGFWVAVPQITPDLAGCQTAADGLLAAETITFLSGSDELDASAVAVINRLAGIMARCAEEVGLRAEIAGHTDNVGDPVANLGLSQRRAIAVRKALIDRGVPGAAMVGIGYGDTQPVADNATDEGRAKNRRTAIVWSE
jgi:OOP family OmpA-OmpF porin